MNKYKQMSCPPRRCDRKNKTNQNNMNRIRPRAKGNRKTEAQQKAPEAAAAVGAA